MSSEEREKANLIDNLLRQGTTKEEIEKVYQTLRARGYGEEEARRRSGAVLERARSQKEQADRRRDSGDRHAAAQRSLFGRLDHCLTVGCEYHEATAFDGSTKLSAAA